MHYNELVNILKNLTNKNIRQMDLVNATGITRATMSYRAKNNTSFPMEDILKIQDYFNINILDKNKKTYETKNVVAEYYTKVTDYDENSGLIGEKSLLSVPIDIIQSYEKNKNYIVINAIGESMSPKILNKDKLLIEKQPINVNEICDNSIYFFKFRNKFFVKRLIFNVNQLIIKSDNSDSCYNSIVLKNSEISSLSIIGKVEALMRNLS